MNLNADQLLALLPILITGGTALLVTLLIAFGRRYHLTVSLTMLGLNAALASSLWLAFQNPQAVTPLLVVDAYACVFMAIVLAAGLASATLMQAYIPWRDGNREELYLLLLLSVTGALVLASSRHMASLFVGLELMSVPLYGMVAYCFREQRSLEAGLKYLVLSAAATGFLLFGMALIYALTGTMHFTELGNILVEDTLASPLLLAGGGLMLAGLGFKLSLAPFHLWTPDVYEGAPAPVGAFLATVAKVAVVAVLLRLFLSVPGLLHGPLDVILAVLAGLSILVGNLLALTQTNVKRLLGYSSIAHFGYLLIAFVADAGALMQEAVLVYLVTYVAATLSAFGVLSLMSANSQHRDADSLADYRGLFWRRPYLAAIFTVTLLSLAGVPLTAGFIGKFYIILLGVDARLWWLLAVMVLGSAIGVYYYLRMMVTLYLKAPGMQRHDAEAHWGQRAGGMVLVSLALMTLLLGVYPQPLLALLQPVRAVLLP